MTLSAISRPSPTRPTLRLVQPSELSAEPPASASLASASLPRCGGCTTPLRPEGSAESQYPGSVPEWGDNQCQSCDYQSAGKDPENRFIDVGRVAYLESLRAEYEQSRRSRGVPSDGLRRRNTLHLYSV